jgi:hypothetical protein
MVWVVNAILGDLVANHTITDATTLRRAMEVARQRIVMMVSKYCKLAGT